MATYNQILQEETEKKKQQAAQQSTTQQAQQTQATQQTQTAQDSQNAQTGSGTTQTVTPTQSGNVQTAQALLQQQMDSKPGAYQSQWQEQLNGMLDKIMNRGKFQYDVNADALYQMYKDQYVQQGKMAMQDTMGQAATLTGGYGNSYAQNAGQQAYQGYLQQLTAKIPELAQAAQDQYNQETTDLYNQYNLMGNREEQDYNRYQDQLSQWGNERDSLYNQYVTERNYQDSKEADAKALAQTQVDYLLSLGVTPNDSLLKAAGYDDQYIAEAVKHNTPTTSSSSGGSGSSSGGTSGGYTPIAALIGSGAAIAAKSGGDDLTKMVNSMISADVSKKEIREVLSGAVEDGTITKDEANQIIYKRNLYG